jgi:hypothetical protein
MTYQKPEIFASYYAADIIGTALGYASSCVLDNDAKPDCGHMG